MDSVQNSTITIRPSKLCHAQVQTAEKRLRFSTARPLDANESKSGQSVNLLRVCSQTQLGPSAACKGSIAASRRCARSQGLSRFSSGIYFCTTRRSTHICEQILGKNSMSRLNIPKKPIRARTRKVKISMQRSKALLESVKMINNSQKENTTPCLYNYFGRTIALKDRIH